MLVVVEHFLDFDIYRQLRRRLPSKWKKSLSKIFEKKIVLFLSKIGYTNKYWA